MTIITITRHYSGFQNRADRFSVGDNETVDSAVLDYVLPDGYQIDGGVIRDAEGYQCEIVPHRGSGRPQLISLAGPVKAQPVLARAAQI